MPVLTDLIADLEDDRNGELGRVLRGRLKDVEDALNRQEAEKEQLHFLLKEELHDAAKRIEELSKLCNDLRQQMGKVDGDRQSCVEKLHQLKVTHENCLNIQADLNRKCSGLSEDKNQLCNLLEKRAEEIQKLTSDLDDAKKECKKLILEKCQVHVKLDEIQSEHVSLEFYQRRWDQEKELLASENSWHVGQLKEKDAQLVALRSELSSKELEFNALLRQKDEELETVSTNFQSGEKKLSALTSQIDELNRLLKEAASARVAMEETLDNELQCQKKLVAVYKESADESQQNVAQITETLKKMQELFNEAKEEYVVIEKRMGAQELERRRVLDEKDLCIRNLEAELDRTNEILNSNSRAYLSDEEINNLSPGAASASKLLKSGMSLAQIYREHYLRVDEAEVLKAENSRLKQYLDDIVNDIESKAALIKSEREDYKHSLRTMEKLRQQLADVEVERQQMLAQKDNVQRQFTYNKAELERTQRENLRLASQVRELLATTEKFRHYSQDLQINDTENDLVLFRNIEELQRKNQQLLTALNEAQVNREEIIRSTQSAEVCKLRQDLESCAKELEDLKTLREKQNSVIKVVSEQRDSYKRLLEDTRAKSATASEELSDSPSFTKASSLPPAQQLQERLTRLNKDFELYRTEKAQTEKMLNEKLQDLQQTNKELFGQNAKLTAEIAYERQRFTTLQTNMENREKMIQQLRDRNQNYTNTITKQETAVSHITQELVKSREEIAKLRVESQRFRDDSQRAKSAESRLLEENGRLKNEIQCSKMIGVSMQELQARVERQEAEQVFELKERIASLNREKESLEKTLQKISEQHTEYVRSYKDMIDSLQSSVEEKERKLVLVSEQLEQANTCCADLRNTVNSLESQLNMTGSGREFALERIQKDAQQLQSRLNYVEMQLSDANQRVHDLNVQLKRSDAEKEHYKQLADTLESAMKENQESKNVELQTAATEATTLLETLKTLEDGFREKSELCQLLEAEVEKQKKELEKTTQKFTEQLNSLQQDYCNQQLMTDQMNTELSAAQSELSKQTTLRSEAEARLIEANETQDILKKNIDDLSAENTRLVNELDTMNRENERLMMEMRDLKDLYDHKEDAFNAEKQEIQGRQDSLLHENERLLDQIQKLSTQLAMQERLNTSGAKSSDTGETTVVSAEISEALAALGGDVSSTSVESLVDVLKYLRKERQLANEKALTAEEEAKRYKHRIELAEKQREQLVAQLNGLQDQLLVAQETEREKAQLSKQLSLFNATKEHLQEVTSVKEQLEATLKEKTNEIGKAHEAYLLLQTNAQITEQQLQNTIKEKESLEVDLQQWKIRYNNILQQRADIDPLELVKLREQLREKEALCEKYDFEMAQLKTDTELHKAEISALGTTETELKEKIQSLETEKANVTGLLERNLLQAKQVGRKYKVMYDTLLPKHTEQSQKFEQVQAELEKISKQQQPGTIAPAVPVGEIATASGSVEKLDKLQNECNTYREQLQSVQMSLDEANSRIQELIQENERLQTVQQSVEVSDTKEHIAEVAEELANCRRKIKSLEETLEEKQFRLDSVTSLKLKLESRIEKMQAMCAQYEVQNTALEREKQDLLQQLNDLRSQSVAKVTPVAPVAVAGTTLTTTSTERPGAPVISAVQRGRVTASIRPITEDHRTIASISPMAPANRTKIRVPVASSTSSVSPGPSTAPDQSSSSVVAPGSVQQVAVLPSLVSTSFHSTSSSTVPQAVVSPRIELIQESEADNNGGSVISSSSSIAQQQISMEATTSDDFPPPTRKRSGDRDSTVAKRYRAMSPQQVTTSDQVHSAAVSAQQGIHFGAHDLVESSQYDESEIVILEEPEPAEELQPSSNVVSQQNSFMPTLSRVYQEPFAGDDDDLIPSVPMVYPAGKAHADVGSPRVSQFSRFAFSNSSTEPVESMPTSICTFESIQRNVPFAAMRSPDQTRDETEADSHSAEGQPIDTFGQYPYEVNVDEGEETSEAVASEQDTEITIGTDEDDINEPTTSHPQKQVIKIRRTPIVWEGAPGSSTDAGGAEGASSSQQSSSLDTSSARGARGRQNVARRARTFRGTSSGTSRFRGAFGSFGGPF